MPKGKDKVLIVEDNAGLSAAYKSVLVKKGFEVDSAQDGQEALSAVEDSMPDIVLLNPHAVEPKEDEFMASISGKRRHAPVVAITNTGDAADNDAAERFGAVRHILKPWTTPSSLIKVVKETLAES